MDLRFRPREPPQGPARPKVAPRPAARGLPEPPPFPGHLLARAGVCVNCGSAASGKFVTPRCWGCGRALCTECYWRHGLSPADHRCSVCSARESRAPAAAPGGPVRRAVSLSGASASKRV